MAVVDVGSNSGRIVVLTVAGAAHLEVVADGRAPFRLARDVGLRQVLSEETIDRAVAALRDFRALAEGAGAARIVAVATSAVREADNAERLVERAWHEAGLRVGVIDGEEEARLAFVGAVHGLPVYHGLTMDIGGGSLELTRFRDRMQTRSWSLPLGSLRLSDRFLASDPPTRKEVDELREHAAAVLSDAGIGELADDERLIGTGGTVRNMAKVDRHLRNYPIPRLHGYVLTRRRVDELVERLSARRSSRRRQIAGLNGDRADSIVGGAIVASATVDAAHAHEVWVSGQGLREGVALDSLGLAPPPVVALRRASVESMASRFATWVPDRARRRALIALRLYATLEPDAGAKAKERLEHAAILLDVGRSVDHYQRNEHAADVVISSDLAGFTHRKLALLAALLRTAGGASPRVATYRPLLTSEDRAPLARAATVLEIADEVDQRLAPGDPGRVTCEHHGRLVVVEAPVFDPWRREALEERFRRTFGTRLSIVPTV